MDALNLSTQIALKQLSSQRVEKSDPVAEENAGDLLKSFGDILKNSVNQINQAQVEAEKSVESYAVGDSIPLHQVMIAAEKADLSLELATQIRNKLLQAYQEISHMSI